MKDELESQKNSKIFSNELFQVYPKRDITNIVESSHYQKIGGWCTVAGKDAKKCKKASTWVKSIRCLGIYTPFDLLNNKIYQDFFVEGPFQSDALLVPEGCLFDHIHNTSRCWPFFKWNQTGALACKEKNMQIRSFAMLLPCGISLFSGVEFVCCPKIETTNLGEYLISMVNTVDRANNYLSKYRISPCIMRTRV